MGFIYKTPHINKNENLFHNSTNENYKNLRKYEN